MAESLRLVKADKLSLRDHPEFNEVWLQDEIVRDPALLGLGEGLYVAGREVRQPQGGRLDLLLIDRDDQTRYELELQLGETDPSHIIRCIEYWDVERKRNPHVEHVAVLVAERVTSRFLNVVGLFNSVIPIIAIQLNALKVEDKVVLNFTRVLDLAAKPEDDEGDGDAAGETNRQDWEHWSSPESMRLLDACIALLNEISQADAKPNYKRGYIGIQFGRVVDNVWTFRPKRALVRVHAHRLGDFAGWKGRLEEAEIDVVKQTDRKLAFEITPPQFQAHKELLRELLAESYGGRWSKDR